MYLISDAVSQNVTATVPVFDYCFSFYILYLILDVAPVCKLSSTTTHTGQLYTTCWGSVGVSVKSIRSSNIIKYTSGGVYVHACQVRVTIGDSGLCCCPCVAYFER